jgi:hypothetical protein
MYNMWSTYQKISSEHCDNLSITNTANLESSNIMSVLLYKPMNHDSCKSRELYDNILANNFQEDLVVIPLVMIGLIFAYYYKIWLDEYDMYGPNTNSADYKFVQVDHMDLHM